jgi:hypothetical protein
LHPERPHGNQLQSGGLAPVVHPPEQPEQLPPDRSVGLEAQALPESEQPVGIGNQRDAVDATCQTFELASTNPHRRMKPGVLTPPTSNAVSAVEQRMLADVAPVMFPLEERMVARRGNQYEEPTVSQVLDTGLALSPAPTPDVLRDVQAVPFDKLPVDADRVLVGWNPARDVKAVAARDVPDGQLLNESFHTSRLVPVHACSSRCRSPSNEVGD